MRQLLARKDVRLLLTGQTLSMFGDWMMFIALAIWAKVLTGSASAAGLVFFVLALAGLVAPLGGLVVDRVRKRPLMIGTHVALAAVMCLLLFVHDRSDVWILYVVAALYGLGGDVFAAARSSMLKAMLPDELLADANGAYQSIREGLRLVAPLAGAGIFAAFGGAAVALVDAANVPAVGRDARRAPLHRAGAGAEGAALSPRGIRGHLPHRAESACPRADDRHRCSAPLRRLRPRRSCSR